MRDIKERERDGSVELTTEHLGADQVSVRGCNVGELKRKTREFDYIRVRSLPFEKGHNMTVILGHPMVKEIPLSVIQEADAVPAVSSVIKT